VRAIPPEQEAEPALALQRDEGGRDPPPRRNAELPPQVVGMRLHRARRDAKLGPDLVVRQPARNAPRDLALPLGQYRRAKRVLYLVGHQGSPWWSRPGG